MHQVFPNCRIIYLIRFGYCSILVAITVSDMKICLKKNNKKKYHNQKNNNPFLKHVYYRDYFFHITLSSIYSSRDGVSNVIKQLLPLML